LLQKAIEAVKSNERSIRKAAEQYGVKKSTLGDHVSGKITTSNKIGRKTIFPIEVEKQLVAKRKCSFSHLCLNCYHRTCMSTSVNIRLKLIYRLKFSILL
jgi:hypothetical protein